MPPVNTATEPIPDTAQDLRGGRLLIRATVTATAVCLAAHVGVHYSIPEGPFFSPVWPASGIALAALLLWGPWMLPAIYAGAAANHAIWGFNPVTMWIAPLGAMIEAGAAAWILKRALGPRPRLSDWRGCVAFLVLAPWVPSFIRGIYDVALIVAGGSAESGDLGRELAVFVMANGTGVALLTPAFMVWNARPDASWWGGMAVFTLLSVAAAGIVFTIAPALAPAVLFPVLVAPAVALGLRGAAPLVALVAITAAAATAAHRAPSRPGELLADYVSMNATLLLLAAVVLPVAAIIDGYRGRTRRMTAAARTSGLVFWRWRDSKGLTVEADGGMRLPVGGLLNSLDPANLFDASQDQGSREVEIRDRRALSTWTVTRRGAGGKPLEAAGTLVDLSDRLSAEKTKRRAWQSEIELRNLRASLTPHLLFNCLAAVRGIVRTDPERARLFIDHLSRFLRDSTNVQSRHTIPLLDEWQLCEDFLDLQAMRYERELPRLVDIEGPAYHSRLPPMILLNLVENAIKHGEVTHAHPLKVTAQLHGDRLEISVRSHGKLGQMPSDRPGGLGVSRARLLATYGNQASLEIRQEGDEVVNCLKLPQLPHDKAGANP